MDAVEDPCLMLLVVVVVVVVVVALLLRLLPVKGPRTFLLYCVSMSSNSC